MGRQYQLDGQILAVDQAHQQVTIKHGDIDGFMPGMTMAFKVSNPGVLEGHVPGELVHATLVVEDSSAHISTIERKGFAALTEPVPNTRVMDVVAPGDPVRDGHFLDQNGGQRALASWRGQVLAVTFVYTRCPLPNFCPLLDRHFSTVQEAVRTAPDLRGRVHLLSFTLDPDFDTPDVLATHAARIHANPEIWTLLTGQRAEIESFASQFGVSAIRDGQQDELVHNLRTAVIQADGRLLTTLSGGEWQPSQLLAEVRRALAGR